MAPCEVSATVRATPATIWSSCFEPMKWESWDPDLRELKDVSGPCDSGTTCTFAMNVSGYFIHGETPQLITANNS